MPALTAETELRSVMNGFPFKDRRFHRIRSDSPSRNLQGCPGWIFHFGEFSASRRLKSAPGFFLVECLFSWENFCYIVAWDGKMGKLGALAPRVGSDE